MASEIRMTHERDAAWLIALYLAIHGGDPAPRQGQVVTHTLQQGAAARAIAAIAQGLDERARKAVLLAVAPTEEAFPIKGVDAKVAEERLQALDIRFTGYRGEHANDAPVAGGFHIRSYCFKFHGDTICIEVPTPVLHVVA
jgi:hypothetical protein